MSRPRVAVVVGSTRPGRISLEVATWARGVLAETDASIDYEIIDLAELDLPMLDEPVPAAFGIYQHQHTRDWSTLIAGFDGFVFVYPQYNWGYPGVQKNALDFLYREWHGKPATLMTWSITGGARGAVQFEQVMHGLHMRPLPHRVEARLTDQDVNQSGQLLDVERTFGPHRPALHGIDRIFRAELSAQPMGAPRGVHR